MRKDLMSNGVGIMAIIDGKFYVEDETWGCYVGCSKDEFIKQLKDISYAFLTSWNEDTRKEYVDFVNYAEATIRK